MINIWVCMPIYHPNEWYWGPFTTPGGGVKNHRENSAIYRPYINPGVFGTKDPVRGRAANMGSKISLLVYEWPLLNAKFSIWMDRFFKIFPNLSQNWLKFLKENKILEKSGPGDFAQNLAQNWADWYMNGSLFRGLCLETLVFVWVYFQIPRRHVPTKTKLAYEKVLRPNFSKIHCSNPCVFSV